MENRYTINSLFSNTECPDQDTLIRYVEGKMMPAQIHQVEHHLLDCGLCSDTVDTIRTMGTPAFRKSVEAVKTKILNQPTRGGDNAKPEPEIKTLAPKRKSFSWMYGSAAAVAVLVFAAFLYTGGGQGDFEVLDRQAQSEFVLIVNRDSQTDRYSELSDAGKFLQAAAATEDSVLAGIAYYRGGDAKNAISHLESFLDNNGSSLYPKILWAYALSKGEEKDYPTALKYAKMAREEDKGSTLDKELANDLIEALEKKVSEK
jgi:hypothetical protein